MEESKEGAARRFPAADSFDFTDCAAGLRGMRKLWRRKKLGHDRLCLFRHRCSPPSSSSFFVFFVFFFFFFFFFVFFFFCFVCLCVSVRIRS
jgi:hypothetical protein